MQLSLSREINPTTELHTTKEMAWLVLALILAVFIPQETETKVVALLSIPHTANVRTHTNVARELTTMGHDPYVLIPQFMLDEKLVNVDGVKVLAYGDYLGNYEEVLAGKVVERFWKGQGRSLQDMFDFTRTIRETARTILSDEALKAKLGAIHPDMFVLTYLPQFKDIVILPYIFNSSFVFMSPFNNLHGNRVPLSPAATPCPLAPISGEMNLLDRLKTFACNMLLLAMDLTTGDDSMVAEFAPHRPQIAVNDLAHKSEIYLVEGDHVLDFAKPELPNTKFIGCTAPTPGKQLNDPVKKFVEGSKKGIALVTFGSSVVNIPTDVAEKMDAAFKGQNLDVVWRSNYTSSNPSHVFISEWLPQNDILAHSNTKLFVSHCGANGQYEALYHGVPMLCLPLFGDQYYNAKRSTARGFGLDASILELTSDELAAMMKEITENATYRDNMKQASAIFRQLYNEPSKMAAFWIDHVMEYGGSYMRSSGQDMPLYQFLVLDVVSFVFVLVLVIVLIVFFTCRFLYRMCKKRRTTKKSKKE